MNLTIKTLKGMVGKRQSKHVSRQTAEGLTSSDEVLEKNSKPNAHGQCCANLHGLDERQLV